MKNLIKGLFCLCTVFILGCESEEALPVATQQEEVNFQLGIDKEVFLNRAATRQAVKRLNDNDVGIHFNTINELTPEDLANKLDLNNGYEFTEPHIEGSVIPIKTHGEVKRNFYSYEMNGKLYNYVITYPDPDNWRYYEVSTIDNQLLSVVEVDESGQGDAFYLAASIPDIEYCEQQVYQSCSSGAHSFALGNAEECDYWLYPGEGSPPSVSITLVACEEGGDNPDDAGGWGTDEDGPSSPPVDTDDPPTDGQVCIEGFDCDRGNTNAYENCVNAGNTDCWQFCEQYACSEEDQNRWELAQELDQLLGPNNWEFDDTLQDEEILEFATVEEFDDWLESLQGHSQSCEDGPNQSGAFDHFARYSMYFEVWTLNVDLGVNLVNVSTDEFEVVTLDMTRQGFPVNSIEHEPVGETVVTFSPAGIATIAIDYQIFMGINIGGHKISAVSADWTAYCNINTYNGVCEYMSIERNN